jgi:hypothetical protein
MDTLDADEHPLSYGSKKMTVSITFLFLFADNYAA